MRFLKKYQKNKYMKKIIENDKINNLIFLVLTITLTFVYVWAVSNETMPMAEGWYTYYAQCMHRGELPYRDFEFLFPPVYLYCIFIITQIFGYKIMVLRLFGVLLFVFISIGVYKVIQLIVGKKKNWIAFVASVASVFYMQSENAQVFYDYVRLMDLFVVIITYFTLRYIKGVLDDREEVGWLYTTGGVTASFAMLGDIILGEPGALVGFAGPRVIKQTIGQDLPEGFQRSEFLVEHGIIDGIITRDKMKDTMYQLIVTHKQRTGYANFDKEEDEKFDISEILKERLTSVENKTPWEKIRGTRQMTRPCALDYIDYICDDFHEIHGDRTMNDDKAIVGGIGHIDGQPVTVIAQVKGSSMTECMERNFGMPLPDGYRKALRLMKQAEKFNRPIITFVNTPGAFCGLEAEERGMGEAIARNLYEMSALKVPVLCILIGEGGSGGALAMAVGNEVWMLENAVYSILSPEGYASILWKDSNRAEEAAEVMQLTAQDLSRLGVIEKVIPEYGGADKESVPYIGKFIKMNAKEFLKKFDGMSGEEIAAARYKRFREM